MLDSPGGVLYDALVIGAEIHEQGYLTGVPHDATCASACGDIWLAGKVRYVSETASVGFHSASTHDVKTGRYLGESKNGNQAQATYYRRIGLPEKPIRHLLAPKSNDMAWLTAKLAYDLGIVAMSIPKEEKKAEVKPPSKQCSLNLLNPNAKVGETACE
jgi:hypothetical protein